MMLGPQVFEALGGAAGCRAFAESFYARVEQDPVLRPLFPAHLRCAIEEFAAFLVQFLGGPPEDSQRRWWLSLRESHRRFEIGERERQAWMSHMHATLAEHGLEALAEFFETASKHVRKALPPALPGQTTVLTENWDAQLALDDAVEAIGSGDVNRARAMVTKCNRAVLPGLLARMIQTRNAAVVEYAQSQIRADPSIAGEYYAGRTLLHNAAGAGDLATVTLLLEIGADPNVRSAGGHAPLYSLANECKTPTGADIVHALVQAGAKIDDAGGMQRCTALHMAARRGNERVAAALLDCGANPEARAKNGDTPMRRALKCRQAKVAEMLTSRGARN